MTPSLFWFKTKLAKAITNSFWDPWKRKIDDYYSRVNSHNKAMGLWALNYVRTEKMMKKETESDEEKQDSNSCNTNGKKKTLISVLRAITSATCYTATSKTHTLRMERNAGKKKIYLELESIQLPLQYFLVI